MIVGQLVRFGSAGTRPASIDGPQTANPLDPDRLGSKASELAGTERGRYTAGDLHYPQTGERASGGCSVRSHRFEGSGADLPTPIDAARLVNVECWWAFGDPPLSGSRLRWGPVIDSAPQTNDPWTLYSALRDRLITLVRPLSTDQAGQTVPLTPGWTIAEVVAHVCGLNADIAAGLREGLGTDERTAYQVATRAGRSLDLVCDEWLGHAEAMRQAIDDDDFLGLRLAADLVVHLHDVLHALDQPISRDDQATISGARTYATRTPDRISEMAGVGLAIELGGSRFEPSDRPSTVTLRATPYDFLRSVTGRRSRREVLALEWTGDPTPVLDHLCPYGPLRSTDAGA